MAIKRMEVIARMRKAIRTGGTASDFISLMQKKGLGYRRSDMLADWREVATIEKVDVAISRIRTGYVPIQHIAELKVWNMSKEFMYRIKSEQISPTGKRLKSKYVNIMSDKPLTIEKLEREAYERAFEQSPPESGEERKFTLESVYRRVKE